jgi:hypothetical protein
MNGEVEQGIERFGCVLEWRPRPTPGCSAIEEEEEEGPSVFLLEMFVIIENIMKRPVYVC